MKVERTMPMRAVFGGAGLVAVLVAASLAVAQPRRGGRPAPTAKPKAPPSAEPAPEDKTPSAPSPSAAPAPPTPPESGPTPNPDSESTAGGAKLSPLNPAANEFSDAGPAPATIDYDRLLAELASLRARVAAVSDTLFHSRIAIALEAAGDHARVAALSVSLDDGVVWTAPQELRASDSFTVYDHAVAPGHHAVTVTIERRDDRETTYRSEQRSRFIVDVPTDQKLVVELKVRDDSNMGGDFPADKKGQYDLRVQAHAQAQPIGK